MNDLDTLGFEKFCHRHEIPTVGVASHTEMLLSLIWSKDRSLSYTFVTGQLDGRMATPRSLSWEKGPRLTIGA